jgi:glycopeptide antibiotics resistance protein
LNDHERDARLRAIRLILNAAIALLVLLVILITVPRTQWTDSSKTRIVNSIPFGELAKELRKDEPALSVVVMEMIGNALLFFPLGVLVSLRWPSWGIRRLLAVAVLFSLAIEILQFALGFGRTSSSTDVLLNTAGAGLGYFTVLLFRRLRRGRTEEPQDLGGSNPRRT